MQVENEFRPIALWSECCWFVREMGDGGGVGLTDMVLYLPCMC